MLRFLSSTVVMCILVSPNFVVGAQAPRTATPITVRLVTSTPFGVQSFPPTVTAPPTVTLPGPTFLQAPETAGNINVRAAPNLDSDVLGTISFGTLYPALRRYFQWYELGYEPSPNGRAWVYGELVDVTGDLNRIQVVENFADISVIAADDENVQAGDGRAAADSAEASRILVVSTADGRAGRSESERIASRLPTFTRPPDLPALIPTSHVGQEMTNEIDRRALQRSELPPLFPIVMLAGFGLIGLLINLIRQ